MGSSRSIAAGLFFSVKFFFASSLSSHPLQLDLVLLARFARSHILLDINPLIAGWLVLLSAREPELGGLPVGRWSFSDFSTPARPHRSPSAAEVSGFFDFWIFGLKIFNCTSKFYYFL
jgi:hypothetical protein